MSLWIIFKKSKLNFCYSKPFIRTKEILIFSFGLFSWKTDLLNLLWNVLGFCCIFIMLLQYSLLFKLTVGPQFDIACLKFENVLIPLTHQVVIQLLFFTLRSLEIVCRGQTENHDADHRAKDKPLHCTFYVSMKSQVAILCFPTL